MELFLDEPGFTLYRGRAEDLLPELEPESFDLIFADPPYRLSNGGTSVHAGKRVTVDKADWDKSEGVLADFESFHHWIGLCKPLLKSTGSIWITGTFHSIYYCGASLQIHGYRILNDITWYKRNAPPNLGCRQLAHCHETVLWASRGKKARHVFNYEDAKEHPCGDDLFKRDGRQMRDVWDIPVSFDKDEVVYGKHATQKPARLLDRIYRVAGREGFTVLDPFMGYGTAGIEAVKRGMRFVGIDLDPWCCDVTAKRYADWRAASQRETVSEEVPDTANAGA